MKQKWVLKAVLATILLATSSACGVIPSEYRGKYQDSNGARLELKSRKGVFQDASGRKIVAKADDLKFENLLKGEAGIYVSPNTVSGDKLELYWVNPAIETRQEAEGLVWFNSEIIYTLFDMNQKEKVSEIEFYHCGDGTVLLDTAQKLWQIGCPANPDFYRLVRK